MKTCKVCGKDKPLSEFHRHPYTRDKLQSRCKACHKSAMAAYYLANRERTLLVVAAWTAANKERKKASDAKWRAENPEACRMKTLRRRALKREVGGTLSKGLSERLFKLQRGKCACCGKKLGENYHLDHIMPLALGGTNTDDNMQLLRAKCNLQKNAKHPVEFMRQRGFLI